MQIIDINLKFLLHFSILALMVTFLQHCERNGIHVSSCVQTSMTQSKAKADCFAFRTSFWLQNLTQLCFRKKKTSHRHFKLVSSTMQFLCLYAVLCCYLLICALPCSLARFLPLMSCFSALKTIADWRVAGCPMHEKLRRGVCL